MLRNIASTGSPRDAEDAPAHVAEDTRPPADVMEAPRHLPQAAPAPPALREPLARRASAGSPGPPAPPSPPVQGATLLPCDLQFAQGQLAERRRAQAWGDLLASDVAQQMSLSLWPGNPYSSRAGNRALLFLWPGNPEEDRNGTVFVRPREHPAALIRYVNGLASLVQQHTTLARTAGQMGYDLVAIEEGRRAQKARQELFTAAALVTGARWPVSSKIQVLKHLPQIFALNGTSFSEFRCSSDSFLHIALRSADTGEDLSRLVAFFLAAGVDPNARDGGGSPAASLLAKKSDCLLALGKLLRGGARPNDADAFGYSLMHHMAAHPQALSALGLVRAWGGDPDNLTPRGETLLHMLVARRDDPAVVRYLIEMGVSPTARDHMGLSAADYATALNRRHILAMQVEPS